MDVVEIWSRVRAYAIYNTIILLNKKLFLNYLLNYFHHSDSRNYITYSVTKYRFPDILLFHQKIISIFFGYSNVEFHTWKNFKCEIFHINHTIVDTLMSDDREYACIPFHA